MNKKVRLKDIVKLANVSVGTVDRVIHKRGEVSEESYKRVMAIVEKTSYTPNLIARTLGSNKSFKIISVVPDPAQDEYWKFAYDGILRAQDDWAQYSLQIKTSQFDLYNKNSFVKAINGAIRSKPDGLLVAPIFHHEAVKSCELCQKNGIPFVLFNNN